MRRKRVLNYRNEVIFVIRVFMIIAALCLFGCSNSGCGLFGTQGYNATSDIQAGLAVTLPIAIQKTIEYNVFQSREASIQTWKDVQSSLATLVIPFVKGDASGIKTPLEWYDKLQPQIRGEVGFFVNAALQGVIFLLDRLSLYKDEELAKYRKDVVAVLDTVVTTIDRTLSPYLAGEIAMPVESSVRAVKMKASSESLTAAINDLNRSMLGAKSKK